MALLVHASFSCPRVPVRLTMRGKKCAGPVEPSTKGSPKQKRTLCNPHVTAHGEPLASTTITMPELQSSRNNVHKKTKKQHKRNVHRALITAKTLNSDTSIRDRLVCENLFTSALFTSKYTLSIYFSPGGSFPTLVLKLLISTLVYSKVHHLPPTFSSGGQHGHQSR